jgi:hypothetical protein
MALKPYRIDKLEAGTRPTKSGDQQGWWVELFSLEKNKALPKAQFFADQYNADLIKEFRVAGVGGQVNCAWQAKEYNGNTFYNIVTVEQVEGSPAATLKDAETDTTGPSASKGEQMTLPEPSKEDVMAYRRSDALAVALDFMGKAVKLQGTGLSVFPKKINTTLLAQGTLEIASKFEKYIMGKYNVDVESDAKDLDSKSADLEPSKVPDKKEETPDLPDMNNGPDDDDIPF